MALRKAIGITCAGAGLALGLGLAVPPLACGEGEINLTSSTYAVDFDSLGTNAVATLPAGFKMTQSNVTSVQNARWTNAINFTATAFAADGGSPTNGGRYNWGAVGGTDRAPGFLPTTKYLANNGILVGFTNNTGHTITQIVAGFVWEQYRVNTEGVTNLCYFSTDGRFYVGEAPLASNVFSSGTSAHGFPLSTTAVSIAKGSLSITNGGRFYFLFYFMEPGLKGQGWAVDDLALTVQYPGSVPPPEPTNSCTPGEVTFIQEPWNYAWYQDGGIYSEEGSESNGWAVGMLANAPGDRVAGWRDFRTGGDGGGDPRPLQPGDRFRITLSGDSRYGRLGCSLNDGAATNSWDNRTNHSRAYVECSNSPDWDCLNNPIGGPCTNLAGALTVNSQEGESAWPGVTPLDTNVTLEFFILSSREFTANIAGQAPKCDLTMLGDPGDDDRIDGFSIYCENNGDGTAIASGSWKQETAVTNTGVVEIGADGGTRTIFGKIADGTNPACPTSPSPNRLVKSGAGVVALGNTNNSFSLSTEVNGGTLRIAADTCLGMPPSMVSNAHVRLADGATLEATASFALNANRGIAVAAGTGCLAVAESQTVFYAGGITGSGGWAKGGTGLLVLSGNSTVSGATVVSAGTLRVEGSLSNSAVTVASGAALSGTGRVGHLDVSGRVDPGNSSGMQATLSCESLALNDGGSLAVGMSNAIGTAGTDWDFVSVAGAISAPAGGTFTVDLNGSPSDFNPTAGYSWKIMDGASVSAFSTSRFAVNTDDFLPATDGGSFRVSQSGTGIALEYEPRAPAAPGFSATPAGLSAVTLEYSSADPVVIAFNETGGFGAPAGPAPAAGSAFAGGTVLFNGAVSPQTHTGLTSCAHVYYSAWAYNGTNYSPGATAAVETDPPAAPEGLHADPTNAASFTAHWLATAGASEYRLDVGENPDFGSFLPGYSNRLVSGTSAEVTGLAQGATYVCRVRAVGGGGCASANSATLSVSTLAPSPFESWLQQTRGLDPEDSRYAPDADDDQDGMTTWNEFLADTDPAVSGSVLRLTGTYSQVDHQLRLAFPASTTRYYQLVYSTNLVLGATQSNLGWGIPGMILTNAGQGVWFGGVRSMLAAPP